jgi:hypothetical protein
MKNLHVLPTDKPSRLSILNSGKLNLGAEIMSSSNSKPQHIYITSDEEIKEGDWCYNSINNNVYKKEIDKLSFAYEYKIILTTDQDLIKDSVQKINDEFLEWFVKNPSCEFVPIITTTVNNESLYKTNIGFESWRKEEQKQHLIDIMKADEELGLYWQGEMKKQPMTFVPNKRMYSEEEVKRICSKAWLKTPNTPNMLEEFDKWFEQFKKK